MNRLIALGIGILSAVGMSSSFCLAPQDPDQQILEKRAFMQKKVEHCKIIIEGLAVENFEAMSKASQELMLLSSESVWNTIQTPEYVKLSGEFRTAAERLRDAANEKNIDGSTLAFFELTSSCVNCHKYLRKKTHVDK